MNKLPCLGCACAQPSSYRVWLLCFLLIGAACRERAAQTPFPKELSGADLLAPATVKSAPPPARGEGLLRYVNPLIGTRGAGADYGGMIPGVTRPFGMTQWTAVTRDNKISVCSYHYDDAAIQGFMGTHQPAIWMGDYGYVTLMPGVGAVRPGRALPFSHTAETAAPHHYAVDLRLPDGSALRTEVAASERAGMLRITFPPAPAGRAESAPHVVLEAIRSSGFIGQVEIHPEAREITGRNPDRHSAHLGPSLPNFTGYFVAQFDAAFDSYGAWEGAGPAQRMLPGASRHSGVHIGAYVGFGAARPRQLLVKIGTSFISIEQARENLAREIPNWDFDALTTAGRDAWESVLGRVALVGGSAAARTIFYTGLYHSFLYPRIFSEPTADAAGARYYSAFDDRVHPGTSYNDYSLWDTFRAEHPLLLLLAPERASDMITALLQMYDEGGRLPMWPNPTETNIMLASHAGCVIADAFVKGVRGYDVRKAYAAVYKDAAVPPAADRENRWADRALWNGLAAPSRGTGFEARGGLTFYRELGYVPADRTDESVSRTIEFGIEDACTAALARELRPQDVPMLLKQSRNYRNLYNPQTGRMAPRNADGTWAKDISAGFTEGDPWTYLFGALHDISGMVELLGGRERFIAKLDENFDQGHYVHENEPGHHYAYLYDYVGQPWKTQRKVRELLAKKYGAAADGLSGNEDCGQMSAWYIFSALGFYPVMPGSGEYALGSPLFERATIYLDGPAHARALVVEAENQSPENVYVQEVRLNGQPLSRPFVRHADLAAGATLTFVLGPRPRQ